MAFARIITVFLVAACALVSGIERCRDLRRQFANQETVLFVRGSDVSDACSKDCTTNRGRMRTFYFCCPGFIAELSSAVDPGATVVNSEDVTCVPRATSPTTAAAMELEIPTCPSSGPLDELHFIAAARSQLCESTCKFPVSISGIPIGFRTRTIDQCCEGDAVYIQSHRLYYCPGAPTAEPTVTSEVPSDIIFTDTQPTSGTTAQPSDYPSCSDISDPTRLLDYVVTARNGGLVCETKCQFGIGFAGFQTGTETRTIYQCCHGAAFSSGLLYNCPQPS